MTTYQFDPEKYLNIYIVPAIYNADNTESTVRGIGIPRTYLPYHPGIVMRYDFFGSFTGYGGSGLDSSSSGKIMIHETGHFFGLLHTFQGACTDGGMDDTSCSVKGDLCCDTRPESDAHYFCNVDTNTCGETNDANDPLTNYMSYREACWAEFTTDQKNLMKSTVQGSYPTLTEATNIIETGATGCNYHTALFSVDRNIVCDTGTFIFTASDNGRSKYEWKVVNDLGNTEKFEPNGAQVFLWLALKEGQYTIILTTVEGGETITYIRSAFIRVVNCKNKLRSVNGNWFFGQHAGVKFTNTAPLIDDNARVGLGNVVTVNTSSSTTCQSTPHGRLLYYGGSKSSDRLQLYNKVYGKLLYSDSVYFYHGGKGVLSIPVPGQNGKKFYIVTGSTGYQTGFPTNKTKAFLYSVLDTSLDGGLGAIDLTKRNQSILPPTAYASMSVYPGNTALWSSENFIAIPKCTGSDYWLITNAYTNNGSTFYEGKFLIYSVQSTGIFFDHMDSFITTDFRFADQGVASSNGRWIMAGGSLFTFDKSNGKITFVKGLINENSGNYIFSPNSTVLYYWDAKNRVIKQKDLTNELRPEFIIPVAYNTDKPMQLGPDGKIYIANKGTDFLSIIHYPNLMNSASRSNACGYEYKGFFTRQNSRGGVFLAGLPNIVHAQNEDSMATEIIAIRKNCTTMKLTTNKCCQSAYSWEYGDLTTNGSGLAVEHAYGSEGSFTVKLYINGLLAKTKEIKLGLDATEAEITGSFDICDTTRKANFAAKIFNSNINYQWTAVNGTIVSANGFSAVDVLWNGSGNKSIVLTATSFEGCVEVNSDNVSIKPQLSNNVISMKNKYCGADTIFGAVPGGGNGTFNYKWRKKLVGTLDWIDFPDTTINFIPKNITTPTDFLRIVYSNDNGSGGCYYQSNMIRITPFSELNTIGSNISLCGIISQGSDLDSITGMQYQWQRSTDGSTWSDVSGQTGKHINSGSNLGSFYFYWRKAFTGSCINYSNVIYAGGNKVKVQPEKIITCSNQLSNKKFSFTLENELDTGLTFQLEMKLVSNSSWTGIGDEGREIDGQTAYSFSSDTGTYFRYKITTTCGTIWTLGRKIKVISSLDTILTQPNKNNTLNQGNNLSLFSRITRDSIQEYQWQYKYNYGTDWYDMQGRNNDTFFITKVNYCQNHKTYRLKITNKCSNIYYSDTANVKVNNSSSITQDYWMKDQWLDMGVEPNPSTDRPVLSPDIFVSNKILTVKPNPLSYEPNFYKDKNYVHAMVRNKGADSAKNGKLYLYWTLAATGEQWPLNWSDVKYANYHWNRDSANGVADYGYFPMGGPINKEAIELPILGSGDSEILYYEWQNIPNPDWYYPITPRGKINGKRVNICVLGRIETCEEYTYGMAFPEEISTHQNAANNNNIATRNLWVTYLYPLPPMNDDPKKKHDEEFVAHIGNRPLIEGGLTWVRNMGNASVFRDVCIEVSNPYYLTKADVYIEINENLVDAWIVGGSISTGLEQIGSSMFRVLNTSACLENIWTDSGFLDGMITYFAYKDVDDRFLNEDVYYVNIDQYLSSTLEGSVVYELRDNPIVPEPISYTPFRKDETQINTQEKVTQRIWAYPNPTANSFTVEWAFPGNADYTITVLDIMGKTIFTTSISAHSNGRYKYIVPLGSQANGIYSVQVASVGFISSTKVLLIK